MRPLQTVSRQHGVTLVGLLVAVGIVGALVSVTLPALRTSVDGVRVRHAATTLHQSLDQARMMAISQGRPVLVSSVDGDWQNGWQVRIDEDNDGLSEPDEMVIETVRLAGRDVRIKPNAGIGERVYYRPDGSARRPGGGLQMGRFGLSAADGEPAFELVLNAAGRTRLATPGRG